MMILMMVGAIAGAITGSDSQASCHQRQTALAASASQDPLHRCRVQTLAQMLDATTIPAPDRCALMETIYTGLDITTIRSSLRPAIDGATTIAELPDTTLTHDCRIIDFGDTF